MKRLGYRTDHISLKRAKMLRGLLIYWLVVSVAMGAAMGIRKHQCPSEPYPEGREIMSWYVALPLMMVAVIVDGGQSKSECR